MFLHSASTFHGLQWHSILLWGPGSRIWRGPLIHHKGLLAAHVVCRWLMD